MRSNQLVSNLLFFIFLFFYTLNYSAAGDPSSVEFLDLRGTACYPQPDQLVSCGSPDTLAILIYTKNIDAVGPIDVNLEFGEGIRYGGFAELGSLDGNMSAALDVISTTNLESPIFRLNEVSQANGGVVLNIAIQALCGVDFVANPPSIGLNLFYDGCADSYELDPLSAAPITPEVVFTGTPPSVTITDVETNFCLAQDFTQVTLDAAAGEVTVTMSDYGFPEITLDEVMLGGMVVDPAFITIDPLTGFTEIVLDGNAISSYFGGDGLLDQNEIETIEFCFQIQECPSAEIDLPISPTMTILTTCDGEVCGSGADIEDMAEINISPDFGATAVASFDTQQLPAVCSPVDGNPMQYIFDVSMTSSLTDPLRGRIDDIRFQIDECAGASLALDSLEMFTGGVTSGALLPVDLGSASFNINDDGRLTISFRGQITDPDGAGGLDDLDGDLAFDDLVGGASVAFRVYMSPASCSSECIPADDDEADICQFFRVRTQGIRDCNETFTSTDDIEPLDPALVSESFAIFDQLEPLNTTGSVQGYDFGTVGTTSGGPVTGTITSQFKYYISDGDFNQCPAPGGTPKLRVVFIGDNAISENITLQDASLDGTPIAPGDITLTNDPGSAVFLVDAGDLAPGEHIFDFDMSIDTSFCGPASNYILNSQLVEDCPDCGCSPFIRACQVTLVRVDPDDHPNCLCDYKGIASSERLNLGYTDRTKATQLTMADFPGDDHPELDNVLPGDYLELKGQYILENASPANGRTERLNFFLQTLQAGSGNIPNNQARLNVDASSVQSFQVKRGATVFDALNIPVTGSIGGTYDGITLNGAVAASSLSVNENTAQPGLPAAGTTHSVRNSSNDYQDGGTLIVYFWGEDRVAPGAFNALQGLYDLVGGGFEDNDTVEIVWHVPVILTPDVLEDGNGTMGPLLIDNFITRASMDARDFITGTTTLTGNLIAGGGVFDGTNEATACLFQDTVTIFNPGVMMNSEIIYDEFGCSAEILHEFSIENPIPGDWYQSPVEYRPSIGLERLFTEWPTPYIYNGGSTYELFGDGLGPIPTEPDSILGTEQIGDAHCVIDRYGDMIWLDAELKDGLRDIQYDDFDYTTDDWSLSGGTFPLLGVGAETLNDPDTLSFSIPLVRLCTDEAPETPLQGSFEASYEYLADYDHNTYLCNDSRWYDGSSNTAQCALNGDRHYWPWTRDHINNPHRHSGGTTFVETGTPVPPVNVSIAFADPLLVDGGGGETNTMTICPEAPTTMIPGGVVILEMPSNVTLNASTPALTFIMNSASGGKIYSADILDGTAAGACFEFELETTLLFCGPDQICASTLPCPADIELVLAKELECVEKACYRYRAGAPELQAGFENPVAPAPCVVQDYEVNFNNTGTSGLTDLCAVIYLPPGLEPMPAGTFDVTLETATGPTTIAIPYAEETSLSGVYGTALKLDVAAMETLLGTLGLEPGESVAVSFSAEATCDFISGSSPGLLVTAEADCDPFEFQDAGQAIHTVDPAGGAEFTLEVEPLLISCEENGANIRITAINTGKSVASNATICLTLPPELSLAEEDIVPAAPDGYVVENYSAEPVGTAGAMTISFDAPDTDIGDYFCLDIGLALQGDAPCGPIDIGFAIKESQEVICPTQTEPCDMQSLASEGLITLEVVPNGVVGEATLTAECGTGVVDLEWSLELESLNGDPMTVDIEFFQDIDGNGMVDPHDLPVGTALGVAYTFAAAGEADTQTGIITIDAEMACPLVAQVDFPTDCACSALEVAFPEVIPEALAELGESVALCPGEPLVLDSCDGLELELSPAAAGTITMTADMIEVALNDGFGVDSPVQLMASYSIGSCAQDFVIDLVQIESFEFPDQEVNICSDGIQQIDLGIPLSLSEDVIVDISPATFLDDPTSQEPFLMNPAANITYTVTYTIDNGSSMCTTMAEIVVTVSDPPAVIDLEAMFDCDTKIITLSEVGEIMPMGLDGVWSTLGSGTFDGGTQFSTATTYTPSQADLDALTVDLELVTEAVVEIVNGVPQIVCGPVRDTMTVDLVCCDSFMDSGIDLCSYLAENPMSPLGSLDCDEGGEDNFAECFGPDGGTIDPVTGLLIPDVGYFPTDPLAGGDDICPVVELDILGDPEVTCCDSISFGVDIMADTLVGMWSISPFSTGTTNGMLLNMAGDDATAVPTADGDVIRYVQDPDNPDDGEIWFVFEVETANLNCTMNIDSVAIWIIPDTEAPEFQNCPPGQISMDIGTCTSGMTSLEWPIPVATDNCDEVTVEFDAANSDVAAFGEVVGVGTYTICYLATDKVGLTADCCFDMVITATDSPDPCVCIAEENGGETDICTILAIAGPTSPLATADCDGGGADNFTECFGPGGGVFDPGTGTWGPDPGYTPTDPSAGGDDCDVFANDGLALCDLIAADPTNPLATLDCDDGGVDNITECFGPGGGVIGPDGTITGPDPGYTPTDPVDPADDYNCENFAASGLDMCAYIGANPMSNLATLDCDGGGVDNLTECFGPGGGVVSPDGTLTPDPGYNPTDPTASADDYNCDNAGTIPGGICAYIAMFPMSNIATLDCDDGGVDNITECFGPGGGVIGPDGTITGPDPGYTPTDPTDPADDINCENVADLGTDLCAYILANPSSNIATLDCDGGGIDNITECMNGGDPLNSADECISAEAIDFDICAFLLDPDNAGSPLATLDCDGGGVDNITECMNGANPFDACDDEGPVLNCVNQSALTTRTANNDCEFIMGSGGFDPTVVVDCDGDPTPMASVTHDYTSATSPADNTLMGHTFPLGVTLVTWTAVDLNGNEASCVVAITVVDETAPVVTCPDPAPIEIAGCAGLVPDVTAGLIVEDNCTALGDLVIEQSPKAGTLFGVNPGDMLEVWITVTDEAGNETQCGVNLLLIDDSMPVFANCPTAPLIFSTDPDQCTASANWSIPVALDNCTEQLTVTQTGGPAPGTLLEKGEYTVTYEAVDSDGNAADVCEFDIIVEDFQAPWLMAGIPEDVTLSCDLQGSPATPGTEICSDLSAFINDFDSGDTGELRFSFPSGVPVGCMTATINKPPSGQDAFVGLYGTSTSRNDAIIDIRIDDNNGYEYTESGDNANNNANFPAFSTDTDAVIELCWDTNTVPPTVTVTIDGVLVQAPFPSEGLDAPAVAAGLRTVQFRFAGNSATAGAAEGLIVDDLVITDGTGAVLFEDDFESYAEGTALGDPYHPNSSDASVFCSELTTTPGEPAVESDGFTPFVLGPEHVMDNCTDPVTDIQNLFTTGQGDDPSMCDYYSYTDLYTWIATDECGNAATWKQNVTFEDVDAPILVIDSADLEPTVECMGEYEESEFDCSNGPFGNADDLADALEFYNENIPVFSDNCTAVEFLCIGLTEEFENDDACGFTGVLTRTWTATDPCGNISQEIVQVITIVDTTAPVLDDCVDVVAELDENCQVALDITTFVTVTEECTDLDDVVYEVTINGEILDTGGSDITEFALDGSFLGANEISLVVIDDCGNISLPCEFILDIQDNTPPMITCPSDITVGLESGDCDAFISADVIVSDNCGAVVTYDPPLGFFEEGVTVVTATATDAAGNTAECTFNVEVVEFVPETGTLACNDAINLSLDANCEAVFSADMLLEGDDYTCFEDYCIEVANSEGAEPFLTGDIVFGVQDIGNTYYVSIVDCMGSGNTCWGTVTIEEKFIPELECPADVTITCNEDPEARLDNGDLVTGEAFLLNCEPGAVISYGDNIKDFGQCASPRAEVVRTWTVEDAAGNVVTCDQIITISTFSIEDVTFPEDFTAANGNAFSCSDIAIYPEMIEPFGVQDINLLNQCELDQVVGDPVCASQAAIVNDFQTGDTGELRFSFPADVPAGTMRARVSKNVSSQDAFVGLYGNSTTRANAIIDFRIDDNNGYEFTESGSSQNASANFPTFTNDQFVDLEISWIAGGGAPIVTVVIDGQLVAPAFPSEGASASAIAGGLRTVQFRFAGNSATDPTGAGLIVDDVVITDGGGAILFEDAFEGYSEGDSLDSSDNGASPYHPNSTDVSVICSQFGPQAGGQPCTGTGYPMIGDELLPLGGGHCTFSLNVQDEIFDICGTSSYEIIRIWRVRNTCEPFEVGVNPIEHVQIIEVRDMEGPVLHDFPAEITLSANPWSCAASGILPVPAQIYDECGTVASFDAHVLGGGSVEVSGTVDGGDLQIEGFDLSEGPHILVISTKDDCSNKSVAEILINVIDDTPPTAIALENIVVSLTSDAFDEGGVAKLFAESVDNGSHDGSCGPVAFEIRRDDSPACGNIGNNGYNNNLTFNNDRHSDDNNNDTDGGQIVQFCCEDLEGGTVEQGENGEVVFVTEIPVILRVWDDGDNDGTFGSDGDNFNETWTNVRLENKLPPVIVCPADATVTCTSDLLIHDEAAAPTEAELAFLLAPDTGTGVATGAGVCGSISVTYEDDVDEDVCFDDYTIEREWCITGTNICCEQEITVVKVGAFDPNSISWNSGFPEESIQLSCLEDQELQEPTWLAAPCDIIAWSVESDTFFIEGNEAQAGCIKVINDYTVLDWCADAEFTFTQTITVLDEEAPEIVVEDLCVEVGDQCNAEVTLCATGTDVGDCESPWLKWQILVDINSDWTIDYEFSTFVPTLDPNFGTGINELHVPQSAPGDEVCITIPEIIASSKLNHRVTWRVSDGCGNFSSVESLFQVTDKKAPTPYCFSVSSAPHEEGVALWACDFTLGAEDNCSDEFTYTFNGPDEGFFAPEDTPGWNPDTNCEGMLFECPENGGTQSVKVYTWDECNNAAICFVELTLSGCGEVDEENGRFGINGTVGTEFNEMVDDVNIAIASNQPEYPRSYVTDADGQYTSVNHLPGANYNVTAVKNDDHRNGVSTLDILIIQRHLLNLAPLTSPYQYISADANNDQAITAADLVDIRKLVLEIFDEFPSNNSWRFAEASQALTTANAFAFNEVIDIIALSNTMNNEDFIANKIGDVNGSVTLNAKGNTADVRSGQKLIMNLAGVATAEGMSVEVTSSNFQAIAGYQFTLNTNGQELVGIESGAIDVSDENIAVLDASTMTMSWTSLDAVTVEDEVLFTLNFASSNLSTIGGMDITSEATDAEAYSADLTIMDVVLGQDEATAGFVLNQNEPNPFNTVTVIEFTLPESGAATLTVMDVNGKIITQIDGTYSKGVNSIKLSKETLAASGVLYYQLDSGEFTATKKMIVVE